MCFTRADHSTKAFEDALKRHSNQHPNDHVAKKFTTIDKQSWEEVLKEILASQQTEKTESLEIFKNDGKLLKKAGNLYVAILDAAEAMLKWQNGNPLKKFGKAVLMQDTYADKLKSKADAINRCGEDFREQFQISANRTVANTDKNVTGMHESMAVAFNQGVSLPHDLAKS
ncbi:hypothetical protein SLS56_006143 [Neofusicoccum ribis]|uniref:Uncharacterized protein n=1 Tax=Neofusicoccum ribis TaxID=45134 RepID=A0ABR3SRS3_9PEZI